MIQIGEHYVDPRTPCIHGVRLDTRCDQCTPAAAPAKGEACSHGELQVRAGSGVYCCLCRQWAKFGPEPSSAAAAALKLVDACEALFRCPNWVNRIGDWLDINNAVRILHKTYLEARRVAALARGEQEKGK